MTEEQKNEWRDRLKAICDKMEADKKQLLVAENTFIVSSEAQADRVRPHLPQGTNIVVQDRKVWDFEHKFEYQDTNGKTHLIP